MDRTSLGGQCRNEHKWIGPVWADSAGKTQVGRTGLGGQCRNEHKWVGQVWVDSVGRTQVGKTGFGVSGAGKTS